jgi:hypothetical protein
MKPIHGCVLLHRIAAARLDERRDKSHLGEGIRIYDIHVYAGLPNPYPICMLAEEMLLELVRPPFSKRVTLENPTRRYA